MHRVFVILALFIWTHAAGQESSSNYTTPAFYNNIHGLTHPDSISINDLIGRFSQSDGLGGYTFLLETTLSYKKMSFGCTYESEVDSGDWHIKDNNILVLTSTDETLYFDIFKLDNFYFFILPTESVRFIKALTDLQVRFKEDLSTKQTSKTFIVNQRVAFWLRRKKYYARFIGPLPAHNIRFAAIAADSSQSSANHY